MKQKQDTLLKLGGEKGRFDLMGICKRGISLKTKRETEVQCGPIGHWCMHLEHILVFSTTTFTAFSSSALLVVYIEMTAYTNLLFFHF